MSYERNLAIRRGLTCPWCDRQGSIVPERDPTAPGLAITMLCAHLDDDGVRVGCGRLGVFEPSDPVAWSYLDEQGAVGHIQQWLDSLKESRPPDAVTKLADLVRKEHEIETLRAGIVEMAEQVHGAYHRESDEESWRSCPYGACATARRLLEIE